MRLFNEKNSKFNPEILADVDDDVIVNRIEKDFAENNMHADYVYDDYYLKDKTTSGDRVELPVYTFRFTVKYPDAKTAIEAAEEFKDGRNLNFVIPQYDPNGLGGIFSWRKSARTVKFELTIPGTIVWDLMKKHKAASLANPQKVFLEYLEEMLEVFVNDDRAYYTKL